MNNCGFTGRMGANPRYNPPTNQQGTNSVYSFSLAVKRAGGKKDANGNVITDWFNFTAFGKTADLINQHCPKGCLVGIEKCHAIVDEYTDNSTGKVMKPVKFVVDSVDLEITFASLKGQNNGQDTNQQAPGNYNNNGGNYAPQQQQPQQNYAQYNQPANVQNNNQGNYNNNNQGYNNQGGYQAPVQQPVQQAQPVNNGNAFGQGRGQAPAVAPYDPNANGGNVPVVDGGNLPF